MLTKTITYICTVILISWLVGCSQNALITKPMLEAFPQSSTAFTQFEAGMATIEDDVLTVDNQGKKITLSDRYEHLESVRIDSQTLLLSIKNDKSLQILNAEAVLMQSVVFDYPVEGFCSAVKDDEVHLLVLQEHATASQYVLRNQAGSAQLKAHKLRDFNVPPNAAFCQIDGTRQTVFIAEEGVAVWAMPLDIEQEMKRTLVDSVKQGNLTGSAFAMAIQNDVLYVSDSMAIHQYHMYSPSYNWLASYTLPQESEIEQIILQQTSSNNVDALLLDDLTGQWMRFELPVPKLAAKSVEHYVDVKARVQTEPMPATGDVADDPAIWVNSYQPEQSRVLGTNKKAGLHVYNMQGKQIQVFKSGRLNNVDVRQGFTLNGKPMDIAAASHRDDSSITLFSIDPKTGWMKQQNAISTNLEDVYGFCMGWLEVNGAQQVHAFINAKDGRFEQYHITDSNGAWVASKVRSFSVPSQPEGCSHYDGKNQLFIGEEDQGIWLLDLSKPDSEPQRIVDVNNDWLVDDVEGIDVFYGEQQDLLVVSSQGNDSYVLLQAIAPYGFVHKFKIGLNLNDGIDGASETDGLAVTSANLGKGFENGMLVVQDGRNYLPTSPQNFKYVSWKDIKASMNSNVE
ncbi:phytase [Bermanella sp. R86510]|uniref:phytase n=1 Tax=unclassified Bermanella TaxID=2627862 RepID=UPI0037C9304D